MNTEKKIFCFMKVHDDLITLHRLVEEDLNDAAKNWASFEIKSHTIVANEYGYTMSLMIETTKVAEQPWIAVRKVGTDIGVMP